MIICGIYKYTSPSGKTYIGSSKNIYKRIKYYKSLNCKNQKKLYNSFKKHGYENHIFEIVEECNIEKLYERERYYGELYNVLGDKGLNCVLPNNGEIKIGISEETKRKMSLAKKGENNTFYNKTHSDETKEKIRKAQLGRKHSVEHKEKVSKNNARFNSKKVIDIETGKVYNSAKEASLELGFVHSTLRSRLNGGLENKTSLKYI